MEQFRKYRPAIFVFIMIAFFMPFLSVSCENREIISITGIGMMSETKIGGGFGSEAIPASPWVLLAGISTIAGLIAALKNKEAISAATGFLSGIFLLVFMGQVREAAKDTAYTTYMGQINVDLRVGYWLALLFSIVAGIMFAASIQNRIQETDPGAAVLSKRSNLSANSFCTHCGKEADTQDRFCTECGNDLDPNLSSVRQQY